MTDLWMISHAAQWVLLLVVLALAVGALRQIGILYQNVYPYLDHLRVGEPLRDIALSTLTGSTVRASDFVEQEATFVVTSPNCSGCRTVLEQLNSQNEETNLNGHTVVIGIGSADLIAEMIRGVSLPQDIPVLVDADGKTRHEWGVSATPTTMIVDEHLRLRTLFKGVIPLTGEQTPKFVTAGHQEEEQ